MPIHERAIGILLPRPHVKRIERWETKAIRALWIYSGGMPETVEQCQKTIELEPSVGTAYAVMSMAYAQMGQPAETLRAAEDTVRISNSPNLTATAAWALARIGQSGKAKQFLTRALEQAKEHCICRFIVAAAYPELGEREKALESVQQAFLQRST